MNEENNPVRNKLQIQMQIAVITKTTKNCQEIPIHCRLLTRTITWEKERKNYHTIHLAMNKNHEMNHKQKLPKLNNLSKNILSKKNFNTIKTSIS